MRTLIIGLAGAFIFTIFLLTIGFIAAEVGTDYLERKVMLQKLHKHVGVLNAQTIPPCDHLNKNEFVEIAKLNRFQIKEWIMQKSLLLANCHEEALHDAIHDEMGHQSRQHALAYLNTLEIAQMYMQPRFTLASDPAFIGLRNEINKAKNQAGRIEKSEKIYDHLNKYHKSLESKRLKQTWSLR